MKEKTFLILINNAFRMASYHIAIGDSLKRKGNKVIYAFTDKMPFYIEDLNLGGADYYIFSEEFEKKYNNDKLDLDVNINYNKTFFSEYDRNIVYGKMKYEGNEFYQKLISNLSVFFEEIFQKYKVDFCIYETISNSFAYMAYEIGLKYDVQYCGYAGSRLKNRFELYTDEFGSIKLFEEIFVNMSYDSLDISEKNEVEDYLTSFNSPVIPSYHPKNTVLDWNFSFYKRYFNKEKFNLFIGSFRYFIDHRNKLKFGFQTGNPVKEQLKSVIKQIRKRAIVARSRGFFDKPNYKESYFLYPQHFKPEASTSVMARNYCNDISVIENIAFNLPFGSYLYVKEHFVNFGRLPSSYYKKLKNIPNVKLISCDENTKELITNSKGVVTLTSTVGYEALLLNKPVFVFGNVFYQCHPNCRKLDSFENLFSELNNLDLDLDESINKKFVATYRKITFPGNIYYHIADENYTKEDFSTLIINALYERFNFKV
ncbi:MAG: hypothetical protein LBE34_02235 [Flavobacteriaceae bacterium]|jgi:hypothetical protein|nr:hypothetical protein [Flavobacteriaceae bacterium]